MAERGVEQPGAPRRSATLELVQPEALHLPREVDPDYDLGLVRRARRLSLVVPRLDPFPLAADLPFRWSLTADRCANGLHRDMALARQLDQRGRCPIGITRDSAYPFEGIELAIRRSKLPGQTWLMGLSTPAVVGGVPGMLVDATAAAEKTADGWLELRLRERVSPRRRCG